MVHWWILGADFPIDTGDHGGCWQWTFEEHRSDCEHVYVIRTSRVLSPDGAWPERWLSGMIEMGRVGLKYFSQKMWWLFFFAQTIIHHMLIKGKKIMWVFGWNIALQLGQKWALKRKNIRKKHPCFSPQELIYGYYLKRDELMLSSRFSYWYWIHL